MSRHRDDEILIVVEIPHRGAPRAYETTLRQLRVEADRAEQPDPELCSSAPTIEQCATALGHDLHALDIWRESDAARLAAQEPTARRHGDPSRTMQAQEIARRLGWIPSEEASR